MARLPESQKLFWDAQHQKRGTIGEEGNSHANVPNASARAFLTYLPNKARILELGCANGRDARWFAAQGHQVVAVDFSPVALAQMMQIAKDQRVDKSIYPLEHDFSTGMLPIMPVNTFDAFYSRSSLHACEDNLHCLMAQVTAMLKPGALILIEGKDEGDPKIRRSIPVRENLVVNWDDGGHVRRVWSAQYLSYLCSMFSWNPIRVTSGDDQINNEASFIRLIARKSKRH